MKASRKRPKGAFRRPFGLVLCVVIAMPNSIAHQDLASLIARQPAVTERWRAHVRSSTLTLHAAALSLPRITGASIPDPYFTQLAALDPRALDATGSIPLNVPIEPVIVQPAYDFPVVERRLKGDRLKMKGEPEQPEPARRDTPSKTKDMASRPPSAAPLPGDSAADRVATPPALPKADRLARPESTAAAESPVPVYRRAGIAAGQDTAAKRMLGTAPRQLPVVVVAPAEPAADKVLRRAGIAAGQDTAAKRVLGTAPRQLPVVVAAPAEPVADKVLRRAGIAAGQDTAAKRVLGTAPRQLPAVVAAPAEPVADKVLRRAGIARAQLRQARAEAGRAHEPFADTADLESARADLKGPIMPPRLPLAETADLESARADLNGPIAPPPAAGPRVAEVAPEPEPEISAPQVVDAAPAPAVAGIVPDARAKTPDRFNAEAVEQLAQFARPGAQTRVFFGTRELGIGRSQWEAWEPDQVPTVLAPPHVDTEIKRAALDPVPDPETQAGGETIAPKGEVTGEGKRPRTPAERLGLSGATRVKHQKCLANAIYFESRGEVERGQMAVAQVILNRAFSGYYPGNVCDVVYQNAHRHLACQFTFACDNHKDVVRDQPRWEIADRIASEALDGKFWLPEIGKATHYHATYVNPWWVRTMTKHSRIGVHIFYRPTRWGSLDEIPVWGDRLDVTGSVKREASPASPATPANGNDGKRAEAPAPVRRSIFDPVEPISLPGG